MTAIQQRDQAIRLYKEVVQTDINPTHVQEAEKRSRNSPAPGEPPDEASTHPKLLPLASCRLAPFPYDVEMTAPFIPIVLSIVAAVLTPRH